MGSHRVLITGGAGFIGSNLANRLIEKGDEVIVFDNLSRLGCDNNIAWLRKRHGRSAFQLFVSDLKDFDAIKHASVGVTHIYHLAGQVAVTTSVKNPRQDFNDNVVGTFNILEAARLVGNDPLFIYSSTNKVYGEMNNIDIMEDKTRYRYSNYPFGIPETQPLDFYSPYGCSKGAADQYVHDYTRIYGLRTVVLRQSCIYGYRQFGVEDQGWIAWFIIAAIKERTITIYGNGKQVRDVLFIDDLIEAYETIIQNIDKTAGEIYNIGGGSENTISIWVEFGPLLEELLGRPIPVRFEGPRPGDQFIYVSDVRKLERDLNWRPRTSIHQGVTNLFRWIYNNQKLFSHL